MSDNRSNKVFTDSLKALVKNAFRLLALLFAWIMRFTGLALSRAGETIERIIVKKSA